MCVCVVVYIENSASFFRKNTFSSRAYLKFIDRKGKRTIGETNKE
jgi:hypothetical protein